jgi:hypothetical protein
VLRDHEIDVLRIVILSGDEQDLLHASGDHELAVDHRAEIARVEESVAVRDRPPSARVVVVAGTHVRAADQDAPTTRSATGGAVVVGDAHFAMPDRRPTRTSSTARRRAARTVAGPSASRRALVRKGAGSGNVTARLASASRRREHHVGAQAARGEAATNSRHRAAAMGLGAVEKITRTARQVERRDTLPGRGDRR